MGGSCRGGYVITTDHLSQYRQELTSFFVVDALHKHRQWMPVETERESQRQREGGKKKSIFSARLPPPQGHFCLDSSLLQTRLSARSVPLSLCSPASQLLNIQSTIYLLTIWLEIEEGKRQPRTKSYNLEPSRFQKISCPTLTYRHIINPRHTQFMSNNLLREFLVAIPWISLSFGTKSIPVPLPITISNIALHTYSFWFHSVAWDCKHIFVLWST